jgi:hypothetical protein
MAVIYLRNADGGAKVAISEAEAAYDETKGWTRFTVDSPAVVPADTAVSVDGTHTDDDSTPVNAMAPQLKGRRRAAPV